MSIDANDLNDGDYPMGDANDVEMRDERERDAYIDTTAKTKTVIVSVDDSHPFDLDSYISQYTGIHLTFIPSFSNLIKLDFV
jgi:hypothetical protein